MIFGSLVSTLSKITLIHQNKLKIGKKIFKTFSATPGIFHRSFSSKILKSEYEDVVLPNQDVCSLLFSRWEQWLQKDALECASTGRCVTYEELRNQSLRFGAALQNLQPRPTEDGTPRTVLIFSPNVMEFIPIVLGTLNAGWSLGTLNSNYKKGEVERILADIKPSVFVIHSTVEDIAKESLRNVQMSIPVVSIGPSKSGYPNASEIIDDRNGEKAPIKEMDPSHPALILYSGGTTGLPKGVVIPHSAITSNMVCITDPRIFAIGYGEFEHTTVTALTPLYHSYGLYAVSLLNLYQGSKILLFKEFDPLLYGNAIEIHQIKFLHIVPPLLNFIINSGKVTRQQLSSVKGAIIAAAPVLPAAANVFRNMTSQDVIFQEGFGMTEILGSHMTPLHSIRIGFCGKLIPHTESKIVDLTTKEPLGPNEEGELYVRTPAVMSHYLNNPEATAETIDEEGWLHTGDVAKYTEDGFFSIVDRIKDILKVKSFQVSPAEIEDALMKHPAIAEAGVVGVPDERYGECPRAYVTLKGKATEAELVKFIEERLSSIKWLTGGVRFVDDLPKVQTGKILRKELKEMVKRELSKK